MLFYILFLLFDSSSNIFKIFYTLTLATVYDMIHAKHCIKGIVDTTVFQNLIFFYIIIRRIKVSLYKNVNDTVTKLIIRLYFLSECMEITIHLSHICFSRKIFHVVYYFSAYFLL